MAVVVLGSEGVRNGQGVVLFALILSLLKSFEKSTKSYHASFHEF